MERLHALDAFDVLPPAGIVSPFLPSSAFHVPSFPACLFPSPTYPQTPTYRTFPAFPDPPRARTYNSPCPDWRSTSFESRRRGSVWRSGRRREGFCPAWELWQEEKRRQTWDKMTYDFHARTATEEVKDGQCQGGDSSKSGYVTFCPLPPPSRSFPPSIDNRRDHPYLWYTLSHLQ